jgi:hypothetical protein
MTDEHEEAQGLKNVRGNPVFMPVAAEAGMILRGLRHGCPQRAWGQVRACPEGKEGLLRALKGAATGPAHQRSYGGGGDVTSTMIYTHVRNRGGRGVRSPTDALAWGSVDHSYNGIMLSSPPRRIPAVCRRGWFRRGLGNSLGTRGNRGMGSESMHWGRLISILNSWAAY